MTDLAASKSAARVAGFEARARAHAAGAGAARKAAGHALSVISALPDVSVVAGYLPIRSEMDAVPTMMALHGLGYRICVPVIEAAGKPLLFRHWMPGAALETGPFNVRVPVEGDWLRPDALLIPLVAFDAAGNRLGYGGGFYDRTLHALRGGPRGVHGYGFAYEGQRMALIPCEGTDAVMDGVITEAGVQLTA